MTSTSQPIRVLQSFPHKIGAARICTTAWHQAAGVAAAGADAARDARRGAPPAARGRPRPADARARQGCGSRTSRSAACARSRCTTGSSRARCRGWPDRIDIVHTWPMGARETLRTARRLGIPTVLERPNAHTRFAYEVVRDECERLGVALPADHEHAYNADILRLEEEEYALADRLLCPSDFVRPDVPRPGFEPRAARAPPVRLRRHALPSAPRPRRGERPHRAVRRRRRRPQGRALRARGVAEVAGEPDAASS